METEDREIKRLDTGAFRTSAERKVQNGNAAWGTQGDLLFFPLREKREQARAGRRSVFRGAETHRFSGKEANNKSGNKRRHPTRITLRISICAAVLAGAAALTLIEKPWSEKAVTVMKDTLNDTHQIEDTIGQLRFVDNLFPDVQNVFAENEESLPADVPVLASPVSGRITARFIENEYEGLDILSGESCDVVACADGVVTQIGLDGEGKTYVVIDHGDQIQSGYYHCASVCASVGDTVSSRQPIARLSAEEGENAVMHLELSVQGKKVDPLEFIDQQEKVTDEPTA